MDFRNVRNVRKLYICLEMYLCIVGVFGIIICFVFNACIGSSVIFCIYEHILKMFFTILENVQKCEQFPYEVFF